MFLYSRDGNQPPISITDLNKESFIDFDSNVSWEQRLEAKKAHPDFHPREFLIGRVALNTDNLLAKILQQRQLAEPEGIAGTRKSLMNSMLQHTSEVGPQLPLFSGRGGNRPLDGEPMRVSNDGRLWGTSPALFRETLGTTMNNPFHYIRHKSRRFDASEHGGEPFVPVIAVFDQELLTEAEGNAVDKTSWRIRHGSPLGAVASMYYFSPEHFTLDRY